MVLQNSILFWNFHNMIEKLVDPFVFTGFLVLL